MYNVLMLLSASECVRLWCK